MSLPYTSLATAANFTPRSLQPPDSWVGHLPFAAWIINTLKPGVFVELGTHTGNSYFSFCQAAKQLGLETKFYAVDTWEGDIHAGHYSEEVFLQVSRHNSEFYSHFSYLLRTTFDKARTGFQPGSIDLLHIDGLHTYEAVKHDFETWLPTLKEGAVVLFHDTMVRERDFGVWKFWKEICEKYPCNIEFSHSNGLGVVQIINDDSLSPLPWLKSSCEEKQIFREYFASLGSRHCLQLQLKARDTHIANLQVAARNYEARINELNHAIEDRDRQIFSLQQDYAARTNSLNQQITSSHSWITSLEKTVHDQKTAIEGSGQRLAVIQKAHESNVNHLQNQKNELEQTIADLHGELARITHHCRTIEGSTIWRLSRPLRMALDNSRLLQTILRKPARLAWLTLTGKRPPALQERQASKGAIAPSSPESVLTEENSPVPQKKENAQNDAGKTIPREIARPIETDYSIAIPLPFSTTTEHKPGIAIICHIFHEVLGTEIYTYLQNIPFAADIFISTDTEAKKTVLEEIFSAWDKGSTEIRIAPNRGRDIAPKLVTFKDVYATYDYALHLHSKQSDHASVLSAWRGYLLESLTGSEDVVRSIFTIFANHLDVGIIAAQHFEPVRHWINWGGNFPIAERLCQGAGFSIDDTTALDFPSGSMFWARCSALKSLIALDLQVEEFAEEQGQIDETLAHAIERTYFHFCEHAGFKWIKIARRSFFEQTPAILDVASEYALKQFIRRFSCSLTGTNPPGPRTQPIPGIPAPPAGLVTVLQKKNLGAQASTDNTPRICIGIVTYNNNRDELSRIIGSSSKALQTANAIAPEIAIWDNGAQTVVDTICPVPVSIHGDGENSGFGKAHNRLMQQAFAKGCDLYIAANPDGIFHPNAVQSLVSMMEAHHYRLLAEATQFPAEHPKIYDPVTFETTWASGACLAISRTLYEKIGGFDDMFFMYCEDVDLSWRARAAGFPVKICPTAFFMHSVTNREDSPATRAMSLRSGILLARKWNSQEFEQWLTGELAALNEAPPEFIPQQVTTEMQKMADFSHQFSFSKTRW